MWRGKGHVPHNLCHPRRRIRYVSQKVGSQLNRGVVDREKKTEEREQKEKNKEEEEEEEEGGRRKERGKRGDSSHRYPIGSDELFDSQ